jgi:chemotaxis response regulator CheB
MLGMKTKLRVVEPRNGDSLVHGFVYLAPIDCHMTFERGRVVLEVADQLGVDVYAEVRERVRQRLQVQAQS